MPDTVDIVDIFSVDVTTLAFGVYATSCPDTSDAVSMSVDLGTSMSIDFDDRIREIQNPLTSDDVVGAYSFLNPSLAPIMGPTSLGDTASVGFSLTALGRYTEHDDSLARVQDQFWTALPKEIEVLVLFLIFR